MKISLNWLKDYIDTDLDPVAIGKILTDTGLEVESIEKIESIKGGLKGVVVGEVLSREKHENADRLSVTKVNTGGPSPLQIVCGAQNVAPGQKVLVATVGSTIYPNPDKPLTIERATIRGVESEGMICAEDELGLGNSHDGIMVLAAETPVGRAASEVFNIQEDHLFEIGLTPNRTDAMGHIGVARDLKAYLNFHHKANLQLRLPAGANHIERHEDIIRLKIGSPEACSRYSGAVIRNITVAESPEWLKNRLRAVGLKPINNIVDITNYVMLETGNPLHAFDLSEIIGHVVIVRNANEGEVITTLDGVVRNLSTNDLLICNKNAPMCIAGVFGGKDSGIKETTRNLFLEAACFNPSSVRKTAKSLGISTDSSFRFERGVDANNVLYARDRAIRLILEIAGGELVQLQDKYSVKSKPAKVEFNFDDCRKLCGTDFSNEDALKILNELEIEAQGSNRHKRTLAVPTYRVDVTRPADVYEEILRIYGFNAVPIPQKLNASLSYRQKPDVMKLQNIVSDVLVPGGFYEIMNNSLTSSGWMEKLSPGKLSGEKPVALLNPLSNELNVMRQSLLPGALATIEYNQNRQKPDLKLFEFGQVYSMSGENYNETRMLGIFLSGKHQPENWTYKTSDSDFYVVKGIVEKIFLRLGVSLAFAPDPGSDLLNNAVKLQSGSTILGEMGEAKPALLKTFGVRNTVLYAGINWDLLVGLAGQSGTTFKPIPKTQFVRRDFSLLISEGVSFDQIRAAALTVDQKLLRKVGLFDVYEGKNLQQGKKSYAVSFIFQDFEKTLLDEQVDAIMSAVKTKLETELGAELR
jgi:phenylalanyl-tRNA synthetase beta chain